MSKNWRLVVGGVSVHEWEKKKLKKLDLKLARHLESGRISGGRWQGNSEKAKTDVNGQRMWAGRHDRFLRRGDGWLMERRMEGRNEDFSRKGNYSQRRIIRRILPGGGRTIKRRILELNLHAPSGTS